MMAANAERIQPKSVENRLDLDMKEGWAFPKIRDILEVNYGKGLKKAKRMSGPIPVYGSNGVVGAHNVAFTQGPTIIVGRKGTVGAVSFSDVPCWPIDTTYFIDEFNDLDPKYIVYALKGLNLVELDTSTAIPGLNRNDLYGQHIPLAPLAEQKRMVSKVEELLARVNAARERLTKVQEILKRFRQSVLATACSGHLTADWRIKNLDIESASQRLNLILWDRRKKWESNELAKMKARGISPRNNKWKKKYREPISPGNNGLPEIDETWSWATIDQITAHEQNAITDGPFGSNLKTAHYTQSGPRVIRLQNIGDGIFVDEYAHISNEHYEKLSKHRIFPGDVAIATLGDPIPRSCLIPKYIGPAIVKADCIRLRPNPGLILNNFVTYVLNDRSTRLRMTEVVHGVGRARLNLKEVKGIPVPLPPLTEQNEIVRRAEALFKLSEAIEKRVAATSMRSEKMTHAILAKAFHGELVPTEAELARQEGRSYESASVLLAKIKAQLKDVKTQRKRKLPKKA